MIVLKIISAILSLSLFLYIWFDSLLIDKLTKAIQPKKLKDWMEENPGDTLPESLCMVYNNLLFQMTSCAFCFSFWLNVLNIGVVVFTTAAPIYLYCFLPITWYLTYILYLLITKLER